MPVTATDVDMTEEEREDFIECVRSLLGDYGVNNILLKKVQFEDAHIDRCIRMAVSKWNTTPPLGNVSWRQIPEHLLFLGTAVWLMQTASFIQLRNQVSVQTDGLGVVGIDDKHQFYQGLIAQLRAEIADDTKNFKYAQNLAGGYGHLHSGYAYVSRFHQ